MRKKHTKFMVTLLIFTMCLALAAPAALAAQSISVEIPVTILLSGDLPEVSENFEIVLKADDIAFPMPEDSVNGICKMIITGAATRLLPAVNYSGVGIYTYTIYQTPGTDDLCIYDDSVYKIKVYITNAEDGNGLESTVIAYKTNETEKLDSIVFQNEYQIEIPEPTIPGGPTIPPTPEPTETPKPAETPKPTPKPDTAPKTGDTIIWPYIALFVGAAVVILILAVTKKKKVE